MPNNQNMTKRWLDSEIKIGVYLDAGCKGLGLRVGKNRKTWFHRYQLNGKRERFTIGQYPAITLTEARAKVIENQNRIGKGTDPKGNIDSSSNETFLSAANRVLDILERDAKANPEVIPQLITLAGYREKLNRSLKPLHQMPVLEITPLDIVNCLNQIEKIYSREHNKRILSALFTYIQKRGGVPLHSNPVKGMISSIKTIQNDHRGQQPVTDDNQLGKLWVYTVAATKLERTIIRMQMFTGHRNRSICMMEWHEIENDLWHIPQNKFKGRRDFIVPLNTQAKKILELHESEIQESDWVLPTSKRTAKTPHVNPTSLPTMYKKIQTRFDKDANHFSGHALRKTMATRLGEMKCPDKIIDLIIGHQIEKLRTIYNKYDYLAERKEWMQKYGDHLQSVIEKFLHNNKRWIADIKKQWIQTNRILNKHKRLPEQRLLLQWDRHLNIF